VYQPPIVCSKTRFEFRSRQLIPGSSFLSSRTTKFIFEGKERLSRVRDDMHQSCHPAFGNALVDEATIEQAGPLRYGIRTGLDRGHSCRQAADTIGQMLHTHSCS
jgi:hypothetical protein